MRICYGSGCYSIDVYNGKYGLVDVEEEDPEMQKYADRMKMHIGEIILQSGDLEDVLWEQILSFLGKFENKQDPFEKLSKNENKENQIVNRLKNKIDSVSNLRDIAPLFSFSQKNLLFKRIMEKFPEMYPDLDIDDLFGQIRDTIYFRNALAHGQMIINYKTKSVSVIYYHRPDEKISAIELSEKIFNEFSGKIFGLTMFLWTYGVDSNVNRD